MTCRKPTPDRHETQHRRRTSQQPGIDRRANAGIVAYSADGQHLDKASLGVDALYAWRVAGGTGAGARFVDIEYASNLGHEVLGQAGIAAASV